MARIRTVKPDFWEDEKVAELSRDARLLFIAVWNQADDEGRLRWSPELLKAKAFPYDDDLDAKGVGALMVELQEAGLVVPYTPTERLIPGTFPERSLNVLGLVSNFLKHQKISHPQPSQLPAPPAETPVPQPFTERSGNDHGSCPEGSSLNGMELKGIEGKGIDKTLPASAPPQLPAEPAEFVEFWQAYPHKIGKPAARKAWKQASRDPDAVMRGLKRWSDFWTAAKTQIQFVPHPATWLNQRRWEDEPPATPIAQPISNGLVQDMYGNWVRPR